MKSIQKHQLIFFLIVGLSSASRLLAEDIWNYQDEVYNPGTLPLT